MVKNSSVLDLFKLMFSFKLSSAKASNLKVYSLSFFSLFLVFIFSILSSFEYFSIFDYFGLFGTVFFGLSFLFLIVYSLTYLFLGAFERVKVKFWGGFKLFFLISSFFVFLTNFMNYLVGFSEVFSLLVFCSLIGFLVVLIGNLSDIFKVNVQRVILVFVFNLMILVVFALLQYLTYLLSLIRQ